MSLRDWRGLNTEMNARTGAYITVTAAAAVGEIDGKTGVR